MDGIHWAEYKENSVTWVSDNHQLLHSWTKLMRQFHLIFLTFTPREHPLKTEKSKPPPHPPIQYCFGLKTDVYNSGVALNKTG